MKILFNQRNLLNKLGVGAELGLSHPCGREGPIILVFRGGKLQALGWFDRGHRTSEGQGQVDPTSFQDLFSLFTLPHFPPLVQMKVSRWKSWRVSMEGRWEVANGNQ